MFAAPVAEIEEGEFFVDAGGKALTQVELGAGVEGCESKAVKPCGLSAGGTGCPKTPKLVVALDESAVNALLGNRPLWGKREDAGVGATSAFVKAVEPLLVLVLLEVAVVDIGGAVTGLKLKKFDGGAGAVGGAATAFLFCLSLPDPDTSAAGRLILGSKNRRRSLV